MSSSQIYSPWKVVKAKFPNSDLSRQSRDISDILDLLSKRFSQEELSLVTDKLQSFVKEIYNIIELKPFKKFYPESSDFRYDITKFQSKHPQISFVNDRLEMMLFILSLLKSEIPGVIKRFVNNFFPMFRSFGIMFCQILCNPTVIEKARKLLKGDSIDEAKNNMLRAMEEMIEEGTKGPPLLNIIHIISSCGEYKTSVIKQEIQHEICLDRVPLIEEDGKALSIAVRHCHHLGKLSLQRCKLDSKFLPVLHSELLTSKVKIMELDVSYNTDMDFSILGKFFKKHQVQKLILQCCCFNLKRMNDFAEQSGEGKIMELDVSSNLDMDFSVLGKLFKKHQVQKLIMWSCSLNFKKLNAFNKQSGEGKIMELDVSSNVDMDFSVLGKLFKKHQVQKLRMCNCSLNFKKLNAFDEQSGEGKIIELDVSWNTTIDFSILGKLFKKHQVQKLRMYGCSLNFEKFNAFAEQSGERKIVEIDVSFNMEMGIEGLSCLACLVEKHTVQRLIMYKCKLNYQKLNGIKEGSTLRKMFSAVSEYINISGNNFTKDDISDLEKNLHLINNTNIEVEVSPDCYLRSMAGISTRRLSADQYAEEKKRESEKVSTDDQSNFSQSVDQESRKHEISKEQGIEATDIASDDEETQSIRNHGKEAAQTSASKEKFASSLSERQYAEEKGKESEMVSAATSITLKQKNTSRKPFVKMNITKPEDIPEHLREQINKINLENSANKQGIKDSSNAFIQASGNATINMKMANPVFNLDLQHNQIQCGVNQALPIQGTCDLPLPHDQNSSPEDWTLLSPSISMYNIEPLCHGTEVYRGIQEHASGARLELAVKLVKHTKTHLKEVDMLVKLAKHENVVRIVESGVYKGIHPHIFIAMELCRQNLREFIEQNSFNLEIAAKFFNQTLQAVIFIHSNGIIHRDLKPDNILISFGGAVKVSDFGISKEIADGRSVATVTYPGAGTEGFKAPETYRKDKIGYKADIFSLAINGYFMFTHGRHPFGEDHQDWPYNIRKNRDLDLSHLPVFPIPEKRDELLDLLKRMLSHERHDRPTAEQVLSDQFFEGQPKNAKELSENVRKASGLQS